MEAFRADRQGAKRKPFYGWYVVAGGFISQIITGINHQGFSTYVPLLADQFGWSKALLAAPRSLAQVETAVLGPVNGYLVDRFGPRVMMISGVAIFGLGLMLFSFIESVWQFFAVFAIMAVRASFSYLLVVATAINNWFRRKRTLGIGLATTGLGVSGVIAIPLIVFLQDTFDWRMAAFISAIIVWVIGIPAGLMMRDRPEKYGLLPDGDTPDMAMAGTSSGRGRYTGGTTDFTLREALHTPSFWFMSVGFALGMFSMSAVSVHQFAQMEGEVGLSRASAATVVVVMSVFNIGAGCSADFWATAYPSACCWVSPCWVRASRY
jgi:sugar phosphate permease